MCLDAGAIAGGAPRKTGPAGIGPEKCGPHAVRSLVQSLPALFFAPILPVSFLIPPGFLRFPLVPQNRNAYKIKCRPSQQVIGGLKPIDADKDGVGRRVQRDCTVRVYDGCEESLILGISNDVFEIAFSLPPQKRLATL